MPSPPFAMLGDVASLIMALAALISSTVALLEWNARRAAEKREAAIQAKAENMERDIESEELRLDHKKLAQIEEFDRILLQANENELELELRQVVGSERFFEEDRLSAWEHEGQRIPVYVVRRGVKNHRVILPDGTKPLVPVDELGPWAETGHTHADEEA